MFIPLYSLDVLERLQQRGMNIFPSFASHLQSILAIFFLYLCIFGGMGIYYKKMLRISALVLQSLNYCVTLSSVNE